MYELYGAKGCPYTAEVRENLQWDGEEFVEYDVEEDEQARGRLVSLTGGRMVPVLVRDGKVVQVGVNGRGCAIYVPEK